MWFKDGSHQLYNCLVHGVGHRLCGSWWRHQVETFSALLAFCAGNSPVPGEFPSPRPVTRSFDIFFDLWLNKRLSKQSWGWWFETPSCSLWRHCNVACQLVRLREWLMVMWQACIYIESVLPIRGDTQVPWNMQLRKNIPNDSKQGNTFTGRKSVLIKIKKITEINDNAWITLYVNFITHKTCLTILDNPKTHLSVHPSSRKYARGPVMYIWRRVLDIPF